METDMGNTTNDTVETMESEDTGEVQYVYDENQIVMSDDFTNITDLILEDGTRAMIVNGTLVTADGQTLILQDGSDLSQYYVDDNTDQIIISKEQEEQFLQIISSQNPDTEEHVVQYVQDSDNTAHVQEENGQQVLYIQEGDQVLPIQEQYQLAEIDSENNGVPVQVVKLENQVLEGMEGVIDLEQFLSQQGMVQLDNANYQYAILKDGKFHIQTMNESSNADVLKDPNGSNVNNENMLGPSPPYLDLSAIRGKDMNTGQQITLSKYMDKVFTRNKKKEYSNKKENHKIKYQERYNMYNNSANTSMSLKKLINKKITIGKTDKGKLLIGKILNVTKKTDASTNSFRNDKNRLVRNITFKKKIVLASKQTKKNTLNSTINEVINLDDDEEIKITESTSSKKDLSSEDPCARASIPKKSAGLPLDSNDQHNDDDIVIVSSSNSDSPQLVSKNSKQQAPENVTSSLGMSTSITEKKGDENSRNPSKHKNEFINDNEVSTSSEQSKILVHKKVVTKDCFDVITRTLTGLMNMESVVKKLKNKTIIIKIIEKNYDSDTDDYTRSISYCSGYMVREYNLHEEADNFSESWRFIPDTNSQDIILGEDNLEAILKDRSTGQNGLKKIANLTIQITINPQGSRTTRVIINPPNMYKCPDCTKSFRTSSALRLHTSECHFPASLECTACSIKFKSSQESKEHFLIHQNEIKQADENQEMYECMECNKRFETAFFLRKHILMHFKPEICKHCKQSFANVRDLKKHLSVHEPVTPQMQPIPTIRKDDPQEVVEASGRSLEQKIYCCHICGRQFSRHSNLQRHIEIHQGEGAMYKCAICHCSYHYVSSLTRHVVTCHVDTTNKRLQSVENHTKTEESNTDSEFLQEEQIVEMIRLEDLSEVNFQYVTETIGSTTEGLSIADGIEILQIPVNDGSIVVDD